MDRLAVPMNSYGSRFVPWIEIEASLKPCWRKSCSTDLKAGMSK